MTLEDAQKMRDSIRDIDHGCDNCVARFLESLNQVFPEIPWDNIIYDKCTVCGQPTKQLYYQQCFEHLPKLKPNANVGTILSSAFEAKVIEQLNNPDSFLSKFKK